MEPKSKNDARWFYSALALFAAWIVGLGVMAYATADVPRRADEPAAAPAPRQG
jgi:hypothetical protein